MYPLLLWRLLSQKAIRSDGKTWPWPEYHHLRKLNNFLFRLAVRFVRDVEICDGDQRFRFRCANATEFGRCMKMFIKETGTCDWIREMVKPGDVFYDIGANIGIYTLMAAARVGASGKVVAFEPHSPTLVRLLANIAANGLEGVVSACNVALHREAGFFPFVYASAEAGASESQLSPATRDAAGKRVSELAELKYATSIDHLIDLGNFRPPNHIKIDVDGNELLILQGMVRLLSGARRPASIQVEINQDQKTGIVDFMRQSGYGLYREHYTRKGSERLAKGMTPEDHPFNMVFTPVSG
jgi:FkbM family methyltransferase